MQLGAWPWPLIRLLMERRRWRRSVPPAPTGDGSAPSLSVQGRGQLGAVAQAVHAAEEGRLGVCAGRGSVAKDQLGG